MSGSPVIRFRLKEDLVALLEERGQGSASAAAKQIVLADLMGMPLTPERIKIMEEVMEERANPFQKDDEELRQEWRKLMREQPGDALEIGTFEEYKRRRADG